MITFTGVILLLLIAIGIAILSVKFHFPYSIGLVIFGILLGTSAFGLSSLNIVEGGTFTSDVFFGILLPPLIYEAGLHINFNLLRSRFRLILFLVFLGVVFSTVLTGLLVGTYARLPFAFALLLGAILSPTDPVAVVDLFKRLRVPEELSTIIESESLLNDGVGIVVFAAVLQLISSGNITLNAQLGTFGVLVLGGFAIGVIFSALAYFLHRVVEEPNIETMISIVMAYGSFHVANAIGASGIISTAVTGIITGTFVVPRVMGKSVRDTLFGFWGVLTFLVNSVIFLSIGFVVDLGDLFRDIMLILAVLAFITLARAFFIYLHLPFSKVSKSPAMPRAWYNTLTLTGVRGAIPIVLAFTLSTSGAPIPAAIQTLIVTTVIGTVLFSTTVQNLIAGWYVTRKFGSGQTTIPQTSQERAA